MRECGQCSLCCKLEAVEELSKPRGRWCQYCEPKGRHCTVYDERPQSCREFNCAWLEREREVPDFMYPLTSHVVLSGNAEGTGIIATVDPHRERAWKRKDVMAYLQHLSTRMYVCIVVGKRAFQVMPGYVQEVKERKSVGFSTTYELEARGAA